MVIVTIINTLTCVQEIIIFHTSLSHLSQMRKEMRHWDSKVKSTTLLLWWWWWWDICGQDCDGDGCVLLSIKDNLGINIIFSNCVKSRHMVRGWVFYVISSLSLSFHCWKYGKIQANTHCKRFFLKQKKIRNLLTSATKKMKSWNVFFYQWGGQIHLNTLTLIQYKNINLTLDLVNMNWIFWSLWMKRKDK